MNELIPKMNAKRDTFPNLIIDFEIYEQTSSHFCMKNSRRDPLTSYCTLSMSVMDLHYILFQKVFPFLLFSSSHLIHLDMVLTSFHSIRLIHTNISSKPRENFSIIFWIIVRKPAFKKFKLKIHSKFSQKSILIMYIIISFILREIFQVKK